MLNEISGLYSNILDKLHNRFGDIEVLNIDLSYGVNLDFFENRYEFITINNPEFLTYKELLKYIDSAYEALKDGGVLLIHALNPENIRVSTHIFYEEVGRERLLPPKVLKSLLKETGFKRAYIIRDDTNEYIQTKKYFDISDVIDSVSKGYSIIAQKDSDDISFLDDIFQLKRGVSLDEALSRFEQRELNDKKHIDILRDKIALYDETIESFREDTKKIEDLTKENIALKSLIDKGLSKYSSLEGEIKILNMKLQKLQEENEKLRVFVYELANDHHGLSNAFHQLHTAFNIKYSGCGAMKECLKSFLYKLKSPFSKREQKSNLDNTKIEVNNSEVVNRDIKESLDRPPVRVKPILK